MTLAGSARRVFPGSSRGAGCDSGEVGLPGCGLGVTGFERAGCCRSRSTTWSWAPVTFSGMSGTTRVSSSSATGVVYPPDGAGDDINIPARWVECGVSGTRPADDRGGVRRRSAPIGDAPIQLDFLDGGPCTTSSRFARRSASASSSGTGCRPRGCARSSSSRPGATRLFLGAGEEVHEQLRGLRDRLATSTGPAPITYGWEARLVVGPPVQLSADNVADPSFAAFDDGTYLFRMTATLTGSNPLR